MKETLLRQWTMLRFLPRQPRKIDTQTLRAKLEEEGFDVSLRTIQRDLEGLSGIFGLVCDERSKPFGWSWDKTAAFDIPGMDPQAALAFSLADQFLQPVFPRSSLQYMEAQFRQARSILDNLTTLGIGDWNDKVRVLPRGQTLKPAFINEYVVDVVYESLLKEKRFNAVYKGRNMEEAKEYEVNPLGIVIRNSTIYLICSLWEYDDIKQLVLHRIESAVPLEVPIRSINELDIDHYIAKGEFGIPVKEKMIGLQVLFDPGAAVHLYETPLSDDQELILQEDGRILLSAKVLDTSELRWWLLGFGDQIEILKTERLKKEFKLIAGNMVEIYGK